MKTKKFKYTTYLFLQKRFVFPLEFTFSGRNFEIPLLIQAIYHKITVSLTKDFLIKRNNKYTTKVLKFSSRKLTLRPFAKGSYWMLFYILSGLNFSPHTIVIFLLELVQKYLISYIFSTFFSLLFVITFNASTLRSYTTQRLWAFKQLHRWCWWVHQQRCWVLPINFWPESQVAVNFVWFYFALPFIIYFVFFDKSLTSSEWVPKTVKKANGEENERN